MTNFDLFLLIIYIVQEADKNSKLIDQVREYNFNKKVSNTEFPPIEEKTQKRKFDNFDQNMEIEKNVDLLPRVDQKLITQIDKKIKYNPKNCKKKFRTIYDFKNK